MAFTAYMFQLIGHVFGTKSVVWLDTPNPLWQDTPRNAIEHCPGCAASVLRYLESVTTEAAVRRTQGLVRNGAY
jgi:hypothetical protein